MAHAVRKKACDCVGHRRRRRRRRFASRLFAEHDFVISRHPDRSVHVSVSVCVRGASSVRTQCGISRKTIIIIKPARVCVLCTASQCYDRRRVRKKHKRTMRGYWSGEYTRTNEERAMLTDQGRRGGIRSICVRFEIGKNRFFKQ